MTKVKLLRINNDIQEVKISGHAFYADYGEDIVCSAISMLCYTIANKLLTIEEKNIIVNIEEGKFEISIQKITADNQLLISTLIMGLEMLEEQYSKNVKIEEV
ncbi:MAG: ribosomal-processing cysteine protease Prp [Mycoplasmatales bacterium]